MDKLSPGTVDLRKSVRLFAEAMELKLRTHDEERGEIGWLTDYTCNVGYLKARLDDEIKELNGAYIDCHPKGVYEEVIDIGNFAMMIFDRVRGRFTK